MRPSLRQVLENFDFKRLPVEGTFYAETYRSSREGEGGLPAGTAMIGMYCNEPLSLSCFHRLAHDEVWHFYLGDPLILNLLYPDGTSEEVVMGPEVLAGQKVQFTVPAGVWQGGCLAECGEYAVFGCTMAPGFTPGCFEAGLADLLTAKYPNRADIIRKLSINGPETRMPETL